MRIYKATQYAHTSCRRNTEDWKSPTGRPPLQKYTPCDTIDTKTLTSEGAMNDPLTELRAKLNALWLERGRPSSRYIAHSSETVGNGGSISHSTASSVLRCTRLPTWLSLRSVVDVLSGDSKLFQALWKEAAKQQDAMTTSGSAVRVDEGTVAEYDFIIPLKPWLTQLERMEGLPEAVLRFDRAALQSPPFSVISSLLSSALPLPIGVTTTFRPRLIR